MLSLQPSASVSAACGQRAALNCAVSSSLHGLSVKHMEWTLDHCSLCSVDKHGNVTNRHGNGPSGHFHCEYATGRLVLVLHRVRPKDAGDYMCKLKSNRGAKHIDTRVELQGENVSRLVFRRYAVVKLFEALSVIILTKLLMTRS